MTTRVQGTAAVCLWAAIGCAGELTDPQRFALAGTCEDPMGFIEQRCAAGFCHVADNLQMTADFESPGAAARLVDQPPHDPECANERLIDSADPSASFMLKKLTPSAPCGERMPYLMPALTAAEKACVTDFVRLVLAQHAASDAGASDAAL